MMFILQSALGGNSPSLQSTSQLGYRMKGTRHSKAIILQCCPTKFGTASGDCSSDAKHFCCSTSCEHLIVDLGALEEYLDFCARSDVAPCPFRRAHVQND